MPKTMKDYYMSSRNARRKFVPMDAIWRTVGDQMEVYVGWMRSSSIENLRSTAVGMRDAGAYFAAHPDKWTQGNYTTDEGQMCAVGLLAYRNSEGRHLAEDFVTTANEKKVETALVININDMAGMTPKRLQKVYGAMADWIEAICDARQEGTVLTTLELEENIRADFKRLATKAAFKRVHRGTATKGNK